MGHTLQADEVAGLGVVIGSVGQSFEGIILQGPPVKKGRPSGNSTMPVQNVS